MSVELFAVFIGSTLRLATPLLLAATGELVSERSGILNLSLEGMMLVAAFVAAVGAWMTGDPLIGLAAGVIAGLIVASVQAVLSVTLNADQIVVGLGFNILALGATTLGYREIFGARTQERISGMDEIKIPGLTDLPIIGPEIFQQVSLVYLAPVLLVLTWAFLRYTSLGLSIRAAGSDPKAVEQAGLSVAGVRYVAVLFTGFMAGLAGTFMSIGDLHVFTEGLTSGAGYLAIAAVIFGNWRPWPTLGACLLFGAATALQFQLPAMNIHAATALLAMLPYVLALIAVAGLAGRQAAPAALTLPYRKSS